MKSKRDLESQRSDSLDGRGAEGEFLIRKRSGVNSRNSHGTATPPAGLAYRMMDVWEIPSPHLPSFNSLPPTSLIKSPSSPSFDVAYIPHGLTTTFYTPSLLSNRAPVFLAFRFSPTSPFFFPLPSFPSLPSLLLVTLPPTMTKPL